MAIRFPAVAGTFYDDDPRGLLRGVDGWLAGAARHGPFRAVISPHAGHVYSGGLAATALASLALDDAETVVMVGPAHRVWVPAGAAASGADAWATPLGRMPVTLPEPIAAVRGVHVDNAPHRLEHCLEVQVPFLQRLLGERAAEVSLCPLLVSRDHLAVADVVAAALSLPRAVVVVSSDLSHYLPYQQARAVDDETLRRIVTLEGHLEPERACGSAPVSGLMEHVRRAGGSLVELGRCSSGDTAGDRDRVVGYAALGLVEGER